MAEITTTCVQCDFCANRAAADSDAAKDFHKIGKFDLCPKCFVSTFDALSAGIGAAWFYLREKDDDAEGAAAHNGRAVELLQAMCKIVIHEQVGNAPTEYEEDKPT